MPKELICPDRLLTELYGQLIENPPLSIEDIVKLINSQPRILAVPADTTLDYVPVIRCRDCRNFNNGICCDMGGLVFAGDNDYCPYGERRAENE